MKALTVVWALTYGVIVPPPGSDPSDDLNRWMDSEYPTKVECEQAAAKLRKILDVKPEENFAVRCERL